MKKPASKPKKPRQKKPRAVVDLHKDAAAYTTTALDLLRDVDTPEDAAAVLRALKYTAIGQQNFDTAAHFRDAEKQARAAITKAEWDRAFADLGRRMTQQGITHLTATLKPGKAPGDQIVRYTLNP